MAAYNNYSSDLWSAHSGPGTTYMISIKLLSILLFYLFSCFFFLSQHSSYRGKQAQRAPATCLEVTQLARNRIRIWLQAFLLQSHFSGTILLFAYASRTMVSPRSCSLKTGGSCAGWLRVGFEGGDWRASKGEAKAFLFQSPPYLTELP